MISSDMFDVRIQRLRTIQQRPDIVVLCHNGSCFRSRGRDGEYKDCR